MIMHVDIQLVWAVLNIMKSRHDVKEELCINSFSFVEDGPVNSILKISGIKH